MSSHETGLKAASVYFDAAWLAQAVEAASVLDLRVVMTNEVCEDDELGDRVVVAFELFPSGDLVSELEESWLPVPDGMPVPERVNGGSDIDELFNDPRWKTNRVRAYRSWLAERDDPDSGYAVYVLEYFDVPIPRERC